MNADAIRHLYGYHFAANRAALEAGRRLSREDLVRPDDHSLGRPIAHLVHLAEVDEVWFAELRGLDGPDGEDDRGRDGDLDALRARWDAIEATMRDYLAALTDEALDERPVPEHPEDGELRAWQILLHVVNHATDHRAQLNRLLHDRGVETGPQDYVFHAYEHPLTRG